MELREKLKQARLDAGLSQRQLCEGIITRNMLSQIENGSAKPSYATLQALSSRLKKPVSFFMEDAPSQNLAILHKAQQADSATAMEILQAYLPDDPMLDRWYYSLLCQYNMDLAEAALNENRLTLAKDLLAQAAQAGTKAESFHSLYQERIILLQYRAGAADTATLAANLPDNTQQMLLRAEAALQNNDPQLCLACLTSADHQTDKGVLLRADAMVQIKSYEEAIAYYLQVENSMGSIVYPKLELCYRELGDYQNAYAYACKQR